MEVLGRHETAMACGHGLLGRPEAFRKRTEAHAGATLYTTAGDYARFVCAVLNGEGFRPGTLKEMITPQIDMDKPKGLGWALGFGTQSDANGLALWQRRPELPAVRFSALSVRVGRAGERSRMTSGSIRARARPRSRWPKST